MLAWITLSCLTPTACPDACVTIAEECGLGPGIEECTAACRRVARVDYQRRDLSYCASLHNCGEMATGECQGQDNHCGGPAYVHVALGPGCGAAEGSHRGLSLAEGCALTASGDWGSLGEPTLVDGLYTQTMDFGGDCVTELWGEITCTVDGQECLIVTREVF